MKEIPIMIAYRVLIYVADFLKEVFWPRNLARLTGSGPGDSEVSEYLHRCTGETNSIYSYRSPK